jgi:molybdopterin/thiamine biosynthesis adenylyltransferase
MNDQQLLRYSRHILLDAIGIEGQQKILDAHVLIIGAGGLGSPAALYLASAGVGSISIADHDVVDLTNLQRQIMHSQERVGMAKVASAKIAIGQINPEVKVHTLEMRLSENELLALLKDVDVVLDCSDNFPTRHAINRACVAAKVPLVSGAAISFDGQVAIFDPRQEQAPCYACLFPEEAQFDEVACSTMGVFAPLVGIIGCTQAAEALKLIMGIGESLQQRLLLLDGLYMQWTEIKTSANATCKVCGENQA